MQLEVDTAVRTAKRLVLYPHIQKTINYALEISREKPNAPAPSKTRAQINLDISDRNISTAGV
jgi:hypothetical protein